MKKSIFFIALMTAIISISSVPDGWAQTRTGTGKSISQIRVEGNNAISSATILNRLKVKAGDEFVESALNKEIRRLYAMGYFSDVSVRVEDRTEGVGVIFTVVEKPIIEKIKFQGNTKIGDARLASKLSVKEGILLDYNLITEDIAEIRNFYIEKGYSRVAVDHKINTDPDTGKATVIFVIDEGTAVKIKFVEFEGNEHISDDELKKYMSTKTAWWFIRKGAFDEDKFDADLERIRTVYRSKGFLDAKVTSRVDYLPDGKNMYLTVVVEEGKEYLIGNISITGELVFPENEIRDLLTIKNGDPFDYAKIREDADKIRTFYYDKGYMDAVIDLRHKFNPSTNKMDLQCYVNSHDEIVVGKINIIGNEKTKGKVVRRELRVYPGEKYDGDRLKLSKERIYNLGYFEDVYLETIPTDDPAVKDLNVTVKETKTGEFSFGGGYSSVDSFIGFAQISQKNFDIANFPTFTGAGQNLSIRAEMGSAKNNYLVSWSDPWIFDYPLMLGLDAYRQENEKFGQSGWDYSEKRTGGDLILGKDLTDQLRAGLSYNLEEVEISDVPAESSQDLRDETGVNTISRLTGSLTHDTRDNKFSPSKGMISGMSLQNAGGFIGGDKDFYKVYFHSSYYHSIIPNVVLELKGRTGIINSYGDSGTVPIYERFFAGGARTIRGYEERAVGPRDREDSGIAVGGEATVIANAEIVFPVFKKIIKGAVFYDVGSVMQETTDFFRTEDYKMGTGVGVRVKTPVGPIKLDWGYPLSDNHGEKKEGQFYFSVSHGF